MVKRKLRKGGIDPVLVRNYRAQGFSIRETAARVKRSPSGVHALLRRVEGAPSPKPPPAGKPRSIYLGEREWRLAEDWALEQGVSRSVVLGRLIRAEQRLRDERDQSLYELAPEPPEAGTR